MKENQRERAVDIWIDPLPEDWPPKRKRKVVYIAGPITGKENYQHAFFAAETRIWERGDIPLNPAALPGGMTNRQYMRICLAMLDCADEVMYLPGWEDSGGAAIEHAYAAYTDIPEAERDGQ